MIIDRKQITDVRRIAVWRQAASGLSAVWLLLLMVLALLHGLAAPVLAVPELRHVDTADVVEAGAVKETPKLETGKTGEVQAQAEPGHGQEAKGEIEEHHPAWQFPGWQTIFAILAVAYYALAVAVLPRIMAKEEQH